MTKEEVLIKKVEEIINAYLCKYVCRNDKKLKLIKDGILNEISGLREK